MDAYKAGPSERAGRLLFLDRRDPAGSPTTRPRSPPRTRRRPTRTSTIRAGATRSAARFPSSGIQYVQWYLLRQIYGNGFWKEFAKQHPRAFDSRVQLFDRLAKGDDDDHGDRRIFGLHALQGQRGAEVEFVAPARRAGGDAADRRRGEQGAASGSREAVRRLGDVAARAEILSGPPEPLLRLAAQRPAADADRAEASRLQADLPEGLGRLRGKTATCSTRNGTRCSGCERRGRAISRVGDLRPARLAGVRGRAGGRVCWCSIRSSICCRPRSTPATRRRGRRPNTGFDNFAGLLAISADHPQHADRVVRRDRDGAGARLRDGVDHHPHQRAGAALLRADDGGALLSDAAARRAGLEPARHAGERLPQSGLARARRQRNTSSTSIRPTASPG